MTREEIIKLYSEVSEELCSFIQHEFAVSEDEYELLEREHQSRIGYFTLALDSYFQK